MEPTQLTNVDGRPSKTSTSIEFCIFFLLGKHAVNLLGEIYKFHVAGNGGLTEENGIGMR